MHASELFGIKELYYKISEIKNDLITNNNWCGGSELSEEGLDLHANFIDEIPKSELKTIDKNDLENIISSHLNRTNPRSLKGFQEAFETEYKPSEVDYFTHSSKITTFKKKSEQELASEKKPDSPKIIEISDFKECLMQKPPSRIMSKINSMHTLQEALKRVKETFVGSQDNVSIFEMNTKTPKSSV